MLEKNENFSIHLFNIFLFLVLINSISSSTLVKAGGKINYSCEKDIFYIKIDVNFSEKPEKDYYPFILTLSSPEDLQFKCMLQYQESQIYCLHSFSNEDDYIEEGDFFQFPLSFPEIEGISWDYQSFLYEVFRRVYYSKYDCGNEKSIKGTNDNIWDIEGSLVNIKKGRCQHASLSQLSTHRYNFDLVVSFNGGDLINELDNDNIYLLQDIWIPLITEEYNSDNDLPFTFAFCGSEEAINKTSISSYQLSCYIPIRLDSIFNDVIKIESFFDKVYIKKGKAIELIGINFIIKEIENSLFEQENAIICPNLPVLNIKKKDSIIMGDYEGRQYTFYLIGTLTNGYYCFKNGTNVELAETYKDIKFDLIVKDNYISSEENDIPVQCVLPTGTPYDETEEAIVKCTAKKAGQKNVDIVLNWGLKDNNNFKGIIIKWPKAYDGKRKNLYYYDIKGISIRQSDCICRDNNFDFYVYVYDLEKEPKISFELPLSSPKDTVANCKLFDSTTFKCSINLKHKKLSKGTKIRLPDKGIINVIETMEGNKIEFLTENFTEIKNENDIFLEMKETCGNYLVVGALKDMGMSNKSSNVAFIIIVIFVFFFTVVAIIYIGYKCKLNYDRGTKLIELEQSKNSSNITPVAKKI